MIENSRLYKISGFTLVAVSALVDLIVHLSGFHKQINTSVHFVVFVPFALGVVMLMIAYLKRR
jgi:hypothetical protein